MIWTQKQNSPGAAGEVTQGQTNKHAPTKICKVKQMFNINASHPHTQSLALVWQVFTVMLSC